MKSLEVGMYVRFKDLTNYMKNDDVMIDKITFIGEVMSSFEETLQIELEKYQEPILKKDIIKASHNIIDLIEVGDYVNGELVQDITGEYIRIDNVSHNKYWLSNNIKTILTKEQFENNCYKIGGK